MAMRDYNRNEILDIIEREAGERGIPRDDFLRFASIETGGRFNERAYNSGSGAAGLFQFVPSTARQYGIQGQEFDPVANTDAAARLYLDNRRQLISAHGRDGRPYLSGNSEPDGQDLYLAHQQGAGGYASIQNAIATGHFSRESTRDNLLNNVNRQELQRLTGVSYAELQRMDDRHLAQAFTGYWKEKFAAVDIPEKGIHASERMRRAQPQATASPPVSAESQAWPAPGNTRINHADRPGEGHGEFGTSRAGGARTHKGIDIQGDVGDPIVAYAGGKVTVLPNRGAAGNMVVIDHDNGLQTRYLHLDKISVRDGRIEAGQQIGTMGRTGNTPEKGDTHLHFEVRRNGVAVDPMPYLKSDRGHDRETPGHGSTSDRLLHFGETGSDVRGIQQKLHVLGYLGVDGKPLLVDGGFGHNTDHAVRAFQQAHGLEADGKVGPLTLEALDAARHKPLISEATHPRNGLYAELAKHVPAGTKPETVANIAMQASENGLSSPAQISRVTVLGSDVWVLGQMPGLRVRVDLEAPTASLQQISDHMREQSRQPGPAQSQAMAV